MAIPVNLSYTIKKLTSAKQIRRQDSQETKLQKQTNKQTNKQTKNIRPKVIKIDQESYLATRLDLDSFLKC